MPWSRGDLLDVAIHVYLGPDEIRAALEHDVDRGLRATPKELPPKWLYDERGCELFDAITRLPEYYPTNAERVILERFAGEIAHHARATTLVELGSGTSEKTRMLLDALVAEGTLDRFVPFDVAEPTLRAAAEAILEEYPGIKVEGVVGDFERHLDCIPDGGRRTVAFLGGTIGNLFPESRAEMLNTIAATLERGDSFLVGTDLVKDRTRLVRAYDDARGVTAEFNRNVLVMINRELGANFDVDAFDHVARFDEANHWIEMRLRSTRGQRVRVEAIDLTVDFDEGEDIRTEISTKFRTDDFARELETCGLEPTCCWTDPNGDFALWLARR